MFSLLLLFHRKDCFKKNKELFNLNTLCHKEDLFIAVQSCKCVESNMAAIVVSLDNIVCMLCSACVLFV